MKIDIGKSIIAIVKYCKHTDCNRCKLNKLCDDLNFTPLEIDMSKVPKFNTLFVEIEE